MASSPPQHLTRADYEVACICPMGVELAPVEAMLDEIHQPLPTSRNQNNYSLGKLGGHNIVIAVMPEIGNNTAATVATQLLNDFPSIRFGLLVGIGGGVPDDDDEPDIRLGDVVVSQPTDTFGGVVQYDLGKRLVGGTFQRTSSLNKPPAVLNSSVRKLQARHAREGSKVSDYLSEMLQRYPRMQTKYALPVNERDQLFIPSYLHQAGSTCVNCDTRQTVSRPLRSSTEPEIHYGTIGSANVVVKDPVLRDELKRDLNIFCIEMEAAGLMNDFPCLVIRGICDYTDSHKNKKWQPYAAAAAAAYMKELLLIIPVQEVAWIGRAVESTTLALPAILEQFPVNVRARLRRDVHLVQLVQPLTDQPPTVCLPYFKSGIFDNRKAGAVSATTIHGNSGFDLAQVFDMLPGGVHSLSLDFQTLSLSGLIYDEERYYVRASKQSILNIVCDNFNSIRGDEASQILRTSLGTFTFSSGELGRCMAFNGRERYPEIKDDQHQYFEAICKYAGGYFLRREGANLRYGQDCSGIQPSWHKLSLANALLLQDLEHTDCLRFLTINDIEELKSHQDIATQIIENILNDMSTHPSEYKPFEEDFEILRILRRKPLTEPSTLPVAVGAAMLALRAVALKRNLVNVDNTRNGGSPPEFWQQLVDLYDSLVSEWNSSANHVGFYHRLTSTRAQNQDLYVCLAASAIMYKCNSSIILKRAVAAPQDWLDLLTMPDFDILLG